MIWSRPLITTFCAACFAEALNILLLCHVLGDGSIGGAPNLLSHLISIAVLSVAVFNSSTTMAVSGILAAHFAIAFAVASAMLAVAIEGLLGPPGLSVDSAIAFLVASIVVLGPLYALISLGARSVALRHHRPSEGAHDPPSR